MSFRRVAVAFLAALSMLAPASFAAVVFVATMRAPSGATEAGGHLYRVDPSTGKSTFVGRVLVDGTQPVGLTGLAWNPLTNALYGMTWGINDASRATLYTVDPHTAEARAVARLSQPLTDISFDPAGRLFGWTANTGQLALVDLRSGKVSPIGTQGGRASGGAFAIDARGNAFVATWHAPPTLDRVDLKAGTVVTGPLVSQLAESSTLRSMAFSDAGQLYATRSERSAQSASMLLRIDPASGQASAIAEIPEDSEAIAFAAQGANGRSGVLRWTAYAVLAAILAGLVLFQLRMRGRGSV